MPQTRRRIGYALSMLGAIVLGLASRRFADQLPPWLAEHAGDALWAAMIYCGCRLLRPGRRIRFAGAVSLLFCCAIECSQLYQADWLNDIRHTTIGGLVLGEGFLAVDLARYAAGIGAAMLADMAALHAAGSNRT